MRRLVNLAVGLAFALPALPAYAFQLAPAGAASGEVKATPQVAQATPVKPETIVVQALPANDEAVKPAPQVVGGAPAPSTETTSTNR